MDNAIDLLSKGLLDKLEMIKFKFRLPISKENLVTVVF